jgi:hypothetical protein
MAARAVAAPSFETPSHSLGLLRMRRIESVYSAATVFGIVTRRG